MILIIKLFAYTLYTRTVQYGKCASSVILYVDIFAHITKKRVKRIMGGRSGENKTIGDTFVNSSYSNAEGLHADDHSWAHLR